MDVFAESCAKLVAFTQVSDALGAVTPAKQKVEMAHRHGAMVLIDGAQAVSHMPVNVQGLNCDWYAFSGHKVFAPTGIGVLYGRKELLDSMPPWQGGGNMIKRLRFILRQDRLRAILRVTQREGDAMVASPEPS